MKRVLLPAVLLVSAVALAQGPDVERLPFTPDSIRQVVTHHQGRIQECYEDHMAQKDRKVEGRLLTVLSSMTFPKPPDGSDHPIEYPFNLKAIE